MISADICSLANTRIISDVMCMEFSYLRWLLHFHVPTGINCSSVKFLRYLNNVLFQFSVFQALMCANTWAILHFLSKAVHRIHCLFLFYSWHCMCCHSWNPGTFCRQPRHAVTGEFWLKIIFSGERNAKRRVRLSRKMDVIVKVLLS